MILARIVGTVVATRKDRLISNKLLIGSRWIRTARKTGDYRLRRYRGCRRGRNIADRERQLHAYDGRHERLPVDAAIVDIVDTVEVVAETEQTPGAPTYYPAK
jgi:microcompartment protein CcmK/EutM